MLWFGNPSTRLVRDAMTAGLIGCITTPAQGNLIPPGAAWCADNGRFGKGYPGDDRFILWLAGLQSQRDRCQLVVAPDVPFDMAGTLACSRPFLPVIRDMGFPVALAAQNGAEHLELPWDDFDVLFIGGDTAWKLGPAAAALAAEAKARGKQRHAGRVNTRQRMRYFASLGFEFGDGTTLAGWPDKTLPQILTWVYEISHQGVLEFAMPP